MRGGVDDRVGQSLLQTSRERIPYRPLEIHKQATVQHAPIPRQPSHVGVVWSEADEIREVEVRKPWQQTVQFGECLVAISRDGPPQAGVALIKPRPAPLPGVPIPVPDEEIEQPRGEESARIDAILGAPVQVLPQDRKSTRLNS